MKAVSVWSVAMPFRSEKQRRFMWVHHPEIAQRWSDEYGSKPKPREAIKRRLKKRGVSKQA